MEDRKEAARLRRKKEKLLPTVSEVEENASTAAGNLPNALEK